MKYLWSDACLLQAIALAAQNGPATLAQVIASADSVNHALPTSDELHGARFRLTRGGFVREVDGWFRLTQLVQSLESPSRGGSSAACCARSHRIRFCISRRRR